MSELKRWTDEGAPEAIECLLRAAESEAPTAASLASTLTSLGIAAGATSLTTGAAASGAADATSLSGAGATALGGAAAPAKLSAGPLSASLVKWIALGSVVGGVVVAVGVITNEAPPPPAARPPLAQPASPAPATAPRRRASEASVATASSVATADGAATSATSAAPARAAAPRGVPLKHQRTGASQAVSALPAETLAAEIAGIDRARALLASGRYSQAVAALDDYERRFPKNHFAPEVLYLRMEAASRAGRTSAARTFAQRLLARYPTSPQSEKARHLLDQKIE